MKRVIECFVVGSIVLSAMTALAWVMFLTMPFSVIIIVFYVIFYFLPNERKDYD